MIVAKRVTRTSRQEQVGATLRVWRRGARALDTPCFMAQRAAYEQAIGQALVALRRYPSLDALLTHWRDDRWDRPPLCRRRPPAGTVEAWVAAACRHAPAGARLVPELVEHVACWHRFRLLLAASQEPLP